MKKCFIYILASILAVVLSIEYGLCDQNSQIVEQVGNGNINWSKGILQAKGIGVPPDKYFGKPNASPLALRAAKMDALRNLLEVTKGVQITSQTTVIDYAVEKDTIVSEINGVVRGAQIVSQKYLPNGTVEIIMQMSLYGNFSQLVLPFTSVNPSHDIFPKKQLEQNKSSRLFTGLVINAKGLNAKPAMSPKILDENGREVYGSAYVSRQYAIQQGMSGYAKTISSAVANSRVTDNPFQVKGIKTTGHGRSNIVISNADAEKLRSVSEQLSFLKKCRVMIVVD